MNDVSSSLLQISPPHLEQSDDPSADYGRLTFVPASQAQIIRSHQRDTSQVARLTNLVSEVLRSIAGTRWLGQKQAIIDLLVKAVYVALTLGAGSQTLGEEYTDIMPIAARRRQRPTVKRRLATIIMLLLPSALSTPQMTGFLRQRHVQTAESPWLQLACILDSRAWKVCSNLHIIAFMFSGRFFEFGRRLGGLQYVSMLPRRPEGQEAPTYQPLGLLMLLPLLFKLLQSRRSIDAHPSGQSLPPQISMPESALSETLDADIPPTTDYDLKNTYLTDDAISLPERQCTLCLESRGTGEGSGGTVAVTECGHVFCWGCLGGLEKAECPLCRQSLRMERLIAAYNL